MANQKLQSKPGGHRTRLRNRFQASSLQGLQDYEALELMLTFALPRIDTKPIARALLKRFNGLWGVFGAGERELREIPGVGPRAALLVTLVRELSAACLREGLRRRNILKSPEAVADYVRMALAWRPTEACLAIFVNARNEVLGDEIVSDGAVDRTVVFPRRVIERALERKASGFLLAHNHPGGQPAPSPEDDLLTRRLKAAAEAVDVRFLDHLIVTTEGFYSYRRNGLV